MGTFWDIFVDVWEGVLNGIVVSEWGMGVQDDMYFFCIQDGCRGVVDTS